MKFSVSTRVQILSKSSEDDAKINIGDTIHLQDYPQLSIVKQIQMKAKDTPLNERKREKRRRKSGSLSHRKKLRNS